VTSVTSDRVTAVRALQTRQGRRKAGHFAVEGPQGVRSALANGVVVHELFVDEGTVAFSDVVSVAQSEGARLTWVTPAVMVAMCETRQPQGVLAVCDLLPAGDLDAVMAGPGPVLLLEAVGDPGNVGTIIRTADAAGAGGVILTPECADVHNGKVVRSTAGSIFHLPILAGRPVEEVAAAARRAGRRLIVMAGEGRTDLFSAVDDGAVDSRTVWVIGSEAHGATAQARASADVVVAIPMAGRAESLNAAMAAGVVLFVTAFGQRRLGRGSPEMTD
jgi:TrmH family RNA methyltransferase